ncbi:MAG: FAD:protein FMN transferase, partial [Coprobacillus sp.]|nr:FAD:protein FMN transferase [Coprobacillus sp.]
MKKVLLSLLIFSFFLCGCQKTTPLSSKEFCLDTIVQITLYDSSSKNILNNCFDLCKKYELVFSTNNKKSELYQLNHSLHKLENQAISKELYQVIKQGLYYSELSKGAFDITIGSISSLWDFKNNKIPQDNLIKEHLQDVSYKNIILEKNHLRFLNEQTMIDLGAIAKGYIADQITEVPEYCEVIDAQGKYVIPGLIDQHVHVTGGGGEGSFHTRTPELKLSEMIEGGITTVVGLLGTDGITRSIENLYAKVMALNEEGVSAYMMT